MLLLQALGSNGSGQLGLGHKEDVSTPQPVLLPPSLTTTTPQPKLQRIAAGGNHTLLLFQSGDLLWSGDATTGACGPVTTTTPPDKPDPPTPHFRPVDLTSLLEGTKVLDVTATWTATIIVTTNPSSPNPDLGNRVYTFGTGLKGELGVQDTSHTFLPTPIPAFPPPNTHITDLSSCMGHAVAVLSNGEAWGWGNGRKGQLGEPSAGAVSAPRRIEVGDAGFKVAKAVCGREFTCLFGAPETGEMVVLGSDKWGVRSQAPSPVEVAGWKEVGAGWGSVFVLRGDGRLLSWGRDDHGQLAREGIGRVKDIAVGSEHTLALTEAGELMVWGWGEHGNCGPIRNRDGEKGERNMIASTAEGADITMIGAGCATSWIAIEKQT
ncbi:regulator of chromosome condensation 1/beta-lactamase-inhibitor protein II [Parachaetomium inaequale]|uniref:Regulator of chromosome condensation 1/beta-lactamase-inhibitor protein II n=1 Tax=Parachaetomium inaequale TaxID=2588326 RepID=A0AAN6PP88_9PEZI|nr:regulator of chromosome condensation 1/beta-lactamase-inhibitor protein II [Parachaetomium inaequale]